LCFTIDLLMKRVFKTNFIQFIKKIIDYIIDDNNKSSI